MKLTTTPGRLGLLTFALLTSPLAMAQTQTPTLGWYGGLGLGSSRSNVDKNRVTNNLLGAGFTASNLSTDDWDPGYKVFGGYQYGPRFSLEGGYFSLGRFGYKVDTTPAGTLDGSIKVQGMNLDAVGRLPFTERFSAIGRVGLTYVDTAGRFAATGAATLTDPNPGKRTGGHKYGFGLQYDITHAMALRVEAERYRVNDAVGHRGDIDLFSAGLVIRFGAKRQEDAPPPAALAPVAPVAMAIETLPPTGAGPLVAIAAPPVLKRVVIAVDEDFEFDKITLSASVKKELDQFARDLRGLTYERITVIGNADRIGTEAYNQKLSERRAAAVQSHLILSGGVPASKIVATGAGESDHRTTPSDCVGERVTAKLKECLAPDRRVDVEVTGTR